MLRRAALLLPLLGITAAGPLGAAAQNKFHPPGSALPPGFGAWTPGNTNAESKFISWTNDAGKKYWLYVTNSPQITTAYGSNELRWALAYPPYSPRTVTNWITNNAFGTFSNDVFTPPKP